MNNHININHVQNIIVCEVCDKKLSTSEALDDHMNTKHVQEIFKCELCDKIISAF